MSRASENKRPNGGSYGAHLATSLDLSKYGKPSSTVSSASVSSEKTIKSTAADKLRQQKILEAWGSPSSQASRANSQLPGESSRVAASSAKHVASSAANPQARATKSTPTAEKVQANAVSQDSKFPCPYKDCDRGFAKLGNLLEHKMNEHDYCKVCNEDFEDYDALHQHKIVSDRHITCTVCSLDFRSEMGRDSHYTQMHGSAHNIKCRACNVTFAKGAALLLHFEQNLCHPEEKPGISADKFELHRAGVAMALQARNRKDDGEDDSLPAISGVPRRGSAAPSTTGGGVPIESTEQPDFLVKDDFPPLSRISEGRSPSPTGSNSSIYPLVEEHILNADNLAKLDQKQKNDGKPPRTSQAGWPVVGKDRDDLDERMANMSMSTKLFPNVKPAAVPEGYVHSYQPSNSGYSNLDFNTGIQLYQNTISGKWECPYFKCRFRSDIRQDLEAHIHDPGNGHRGFEHVCPSCLRRFKSPSALVAHLESASTRCKIRDSKGYNNILHLVSGGHLNVDGRHNDGSIRLLSPEDAGKIPDIIW